MINENDVLQVLIETRKEIQFKEKVSYDEFDKAIGDISLLSGIRDESIETWLSRNNINKDNWRKEYKNKLVTAFYKGRNKK